MKGCGTTWYLVVSFVSSATHAWIYPIYARLRSDATFGLLSPVHQFDALATNSRNVRSAYPVRRVAAPTGAPEYGRVVVAAHLTFHSA